MSSATVVIGAVRVNYCLTVHVVYCGTIVNVGSIGVDIVIHVYIVCAFDYTKPTVRTVFQILEKKIAYKASKLADKKFTLKAPITTAADDIHKYFSLFSAKI